MRHGIFFDMMPSWTSIFRREEVSPNKVGNGMRKAKPGRE